MRLAELTQLSSVWYLLKRGRLCSGLPWTCVNCLGLSSCSSGIQCCSHCPYTMERMFLSWCSATLWPRVSHPLWALGRSAGKTYQNFWNQQRAMDGWLSGQSSAFCDQINGDTIISLHVCAKNLELSGSVLFFFFFFATNGYKSSIL